MATVSYESLRDGGVFTREEFALLAEAVGSDAVAEEQAILSVGREFLPPCALAVLDGGEPTRDYWQWLGAQTCAAQDEHDAGVRA